jgi:hypothetical protein
MQWLITPMIMGHFTQHSLQFPNSTVTGNLSLLCRKEVDRLGARYYSRGIDVRGKVSNFVETEQILSIEGKGSW